MFASSRHHDHPLSWTQVCRWGARTIAIVLVVSWTAYFVAEVFRPDFSIPATLRMQGAALAVVFAAYAIGWRWELAGGALAVLGTLAFFAVNAFVVGRVPALGALWFAAPGLLYLEAWRETRHASRHA